MARAGVGEYHVSQAADRLRAKGISPTVDTVRRELGDTGSRTTINNYLRVWRDRDQLRERSATDLGEPLRHLLNGHAQTILQTLEEASKTKFDDELKKYETNILLKEQQLTEQQTINKNQQLEILELQKSIDQLNSELIFNRSVLNDLREENQHFRESLAASQTMTSSLQTQLQEVKKSAETERKHSENERVKALALRDEEQKENIKELNAVKAELEIRARTILIQASQLTDSRTQLSILQSEVKKSGAEVLRTRNDWQAGKLELEEVQKEAAITREKLTDREKTISQLQHEITQRWNQEKNQLQDLATAISHFSNQLSNTKIVKPKQSRKKLPSDTVDAI